MPVFHFRVKDDVNPILFGQPCVFYRTPEAKKESRPLIFNDLLLALGG